jgi:anaerobic nitric oxide reductase flavorubredoxin
LLPNDAFGQHYATSVRFDDEVDQCELMDEVQKYYANILWPFSTVIGKKIDEIKGLNLAIDMIAPSHGIIWRKDPGKVLNAYAQWTKNTIKPVAVIVYETMWQSTAKMAKKIAEGCHDTGVEVKLYDIAETDRTEVVNQMLQAGGFLIGSSTHDNDMLTSVAGFLDFLKGLKPKNRISGAFGSYGWAGGAVKSIESALKEAGTEIVEPGLAFQYVPDEAALKSCYDWGKDFGNKLLAKFKE